ncbi:MAG: GTPase Era [Chitinispirillaceae bacterium]|jgi:GTP-binding protein Era|nr:GTPase Era [Chitinispirillaceae bacterium]
MSEPFHSGFAAIIGRPNSGKSTLLNAILGEELSPVTPVPQTTQRRIKGIFTDEKQQIVFIDTPGVHKGKHRFNEVMLKEVEDAACESEIDVICYIVDLSREIGDEEAIVARMAQMTRVPVLIVFNKRDLCDDPAAKSAAFFRQFPDLAGSAAVTVAASKSGAKEQVLDALAPFIKEGPQYFDDDSLTDAPLRFFAAEFIRKQIILATREEVPHSVFVEIEFYREEEARHLVGATIHVETAGQRGIIVGRQGSVLGGIRQKAERELSVLAGMPVQITCHVKVSPHWRDSAEFLRTMLPQ